VPAPNGLRGRPSSVKGFQALDDEIEERPRYNIAPTQPVITVRKEHGKKTRHFTNMRWGLIPSWAKDMSIGTRTPNARSESVTTTPAFRDSILTKRCLIPADGFYEWHKIGSVKQPYCFEFGEGEVFAFAGLWDEWTSTNGEVIESCTVLTTGPEFSSRRSARSNASHCGAGKYDLWLDPDVTDFEEIRDILKPCDANLMRRYPVSMKLNNSRIDDAESASPVRLDTRTQAKLV
jgi:putative SOS response-associated peptidase YedK